MGIQIQSEYKTQTPFEKTLPALKLAQELAKMEFSLTGNLRALSIVSEDIVWVSGSEGKVYRTDDGGGFWHDCHIQDSTADFRSFHAFSAQEACAASAGRSEEGNAQVFRTEDGGNTWNKVLEISQKGFFMCSMAFWDSMNGIILCDPVEGYFRIYFTENGGRDWQLMDINHQLGSFPNEVLFAASNTCMTLREDGKVWFATGGGGIARVFSSKDYGKTWEVSETPIKTRSQLSGIFSLAFRNSLEGIAVGGDYLAPEEFPYPNITITRDGGRSWKPVHDPHFVAKCLFCVDWNENQAVIVEGSSKTFHSVKSFQNKLWLAGPAKIALKT